MLTRILTPTLLVAASLGGCSSNSKSYPGIDGVAQKGPFVVGSSVRIQELDERLAATGRVFEVQTTDHLGRFSTPARIGSRYVEVIVHGYYYNEVDGVLSDAPLTLRAISDLENGTSLRINVLTTLARDRIVTLVQQGTAYEQARANAEDEVLAMFGVARPVADAAFDRLDISADGTANAQLLAASVMAQGVQAVTAVSELLSNVDLDLAPDGTLDDAALKEQLAGGGEYVCLPDVRTNLETRLASQGLAVTVPRFEDWVDSDGNGVPNVLDPDSLLWTPTPPPGFAGRYGHAAASFAGKLWILGGSVLSLDPTTPAALSSEIWSSTDGSTWTPVGAGAWAARQGAAAAVHGGKLWLMGGWTTSGRRNDVWVSDDGASWTQVSASAAWAPRSDLAATSFGGKLWVVGGHTTDANPAGVADDVWYSTDGAAWTLAATAPLGEPAVLNGLAVLDDVLWAISASGTAYRSANGASWAAVSRPPIRSLAAWNGALWGISHEPIARDRVWRSTDGATWAAGPVTPHCIALGYAEQLVVHGDRLWNMSLPPNPELKHGFPSLGPYRP